MTRLWVHVVLWSCSLQEVNTDLEISCFDPCILCGPREKSFEQFGL
jgi:hypothetical protein